MRTRICIVLILVSVIQSTLTAQGFYALKAKTIDGKEFNFSELKGKKVIIVNTASKCGYTSQYHDLEKVYNEYKNKNLVIIGFPANNFGKQEPGTNEEIKEFCKKNYGVSFQMMEKVSVKGDDMHPVYQWLTEKKLNGAFDSAVKWNFQKYLINEKGNLEEIAYPTEKPTDYKILSWINK